MEKTDSGIELEDAEGEPDESIAPESSQAALKGQQARASRNISIQSMLSLEGSPSYCA